MSDFFLDFRDRSKRDILKVCNNMKYYNDMTISKLETEKYSIIISRADSLEIWGPYTSPDQSISVFLTGRIAMDRAQWEKAADVPGVGGLACKAIYQMYQDEKVKCFSKLNGNFVVIISDHKLSKCFICIDRCGMVMCFASGMQNGKIVLSSNPDLIASTISGESNLDLTSMSEFLVTGRVSFPHTYYKDIKALDYGSIHTIDFNKIIPQYEPIIKYYSFHFNIDRTSEMDLAKQLGNSFNKALEKRTAPMFGKTAISLSGGLDSRAILCSIDDRINIKTFCFFDEENLEYATAKSIAEESGVEFIPLRRDFDYYGNSMQMGAKISGGMSNLNNNHFLGFRDRFKKHGIDNIIAGFYCDYLFKGLVLDHEIDKLTMLEKIGNFRYQNYMQHFWVDTQYKDQIMERLINMFPLELQNDKSDQAKLEIAHRRAFPFYYEPDSCETTIPQRVLGWYLPIVDNDILCIYQKIPPYFKLNASLFSKMAYMQCGKNISNIINTNTNAKINAAKLQIVFQKYKQRLKSKLKSTYNYKLATQGSWPNRQYYFINSPKIKSLYERRINTDVDNIFWQISGNRLSELSDFHLTNPTLLYRILTLKLWLEERVQ